MVNWKILFILSIVIVGIWLITQSQPIHPNIVAEEKYIKTIQTALNKTGYANSTYIKNIYVDTSVNITALCYNERNIQSGGDSSCNDVTDKENMPLIPLITIVPKAVFSNDTDKENMLPSTTLVPFSNDVTDKENKLVGLVWYRLDDTGKIIDSDVYIARIEDYVGYSNTFHSTLYWGIGYVDGLAKGLSKPNRGRYAHEYANIYAKDKENSSYYLNLNQSYTDLNQQYLNLKDQYYKLDPQFQKFKSEVNITTSRLSQWNKYGSTVPSDLYNEYLNDYNSNAQAITKYNDIVDKMNALSDKMNVLSDKMNSISKEMDIYINTTEELE